MILRVPKDFSLYHKSEAKILKSHNPLVFVRRYST